MSKSEKRIDEAREQVAAAEQALADVRAKRAEQAEWLREHPWESDREDRDHVGELEAEISQWECMFAVDAAQRKLSELERLQRLEAGDQDARLCDPKACLDDIDRLLQTADEYHAQIRALQGGAIDDVASHAKQLGQLRAVERAALGGAMARVQQAREAKKREFERWVDGGHKTTRPIAFPHVPGDLNAPSTNPYQCRKGLQAAVEGAEPPNPYGQRIEMLRNSLDTVLVAREKTRRQRKVLEKRRDTLARSAFEAAERAEARFQAKGAAELAEAQKATVEREELLAAARKRAHEPLPKAPDGTPSRTDKVQREAPADEHRGRSDGAI